MNMTQPNGRSGTFRVPITRAGETRIEDSAVFGDIVNRLGSFESLSMEPEQLKKVLDRYAKYQHLFTEV